jgi:DNA polymerase epsilon subunit 3
VGKAAKQAFVKAAGIFVLYLTYCSTDYCRQHHRSTISARDVIDALHELEFEEYVDDLQESLVKFRTSQQGKKDEKKKRDAKRESEKRAAAAMIPAAVAGASDSKK